MEYDAQSIYEDIKLLLKDALTEVAYDSWFSKLKPLTVENNTLILESSEALAKTIIASKYSDLMIKCFQQLNYSELTFKIVDQNTYTPQPKQDENEILAELIQKSNLNFRYTFDQFVAGDNNLAYASAVAVAEMPGATFNPLFIWGGSGLGKTHLMQSIGHHILRTDHSKKVLYVSCETFMNEMISAIRTNTTYQFRDKYRQIDILLVDDIQFLGGRIETQEEFFHTFNSLYEAGKQIVVSSDRPPEEIERLEDRIRTRFRQGMVTDVKPPDFETRLAILQKKVETEAFEIPFENTALSFIADNISSNIRELEGALKRAHLFARLHHAESIDESIAREAMKDYISTTRDNKITTYRVMEAVCETFNLRMEDMKSSKRSREIAYPRQIAMYLCRKLTEESLNNIGTSFGGRDHSTVIHACDKIAADLTMKHGDELRRTLDDIQRRITGD